MSLNFVTFNQDHTLLAVATSRGFRIYYTDPFNLCFQSHDGDIGILEMLFSTSLVALILSPRLLRIQNTKRQSTICELTFPTMVLAVRLNRKRLVVVLQDQIYLYDISNMNMLYMIETSPNPNAICALSPSAESNYLAYPLPTKAPPSAFAPPSHAPPAATHIVPTTGQLMIFDANKMEAVNVIDAHRTPLSCIATNSEGTLLATASDKGTIIRVFSIPEGRKLYQFRRGSIPARIYSMSFNTTSTLLCVSSATETVHIFRLAPNADKADRGTLDAAAPSKQVANALDASRARSQSPSSTDGGDSSSFSERPDSSDIHGPRKPANPTFASMIRRTSQTVGKSFAATVGGYLPQAVTEIWEPARDFAWVKIPRSSGGNSSAPLRTVVAMSPNGPQAMVVTSEGHFYVFNIDLENGGEGTLLYQHSVLGQEKHGRLDD